MRKKKEEYFQKLYEETYDELLRYVSKLYWYDAAMVEDILQETLNPTAPPPRRPSVRPPCP